MAATGVLLVAFAGVALAAVSAPWGCLATSKHRHSVVSILALCSKPGCRIATGVGVWVSTGNLAHPHATCPYGKFALRVVNPRRRNRIATSGVFRANGALVRLSVTATFTAGHRVTGRVTGPRACGGTDSDAAKGIQSG
jgi:hypothetical protein